MTNNKNKLFVLLIILAVSIFGSVMLTRQTQELRRKAADGYIQSFEPVSITGMKVGGTASVTVLAETPLGFKSATILICYPDYLKELTKDDIKLSDYFTIDLPPIRRVDLGYSGKICSVIEAMVSIDDATKTGAPAGISQVAKLTFTGNKVGTGGKIEAIIGPVSGREYGKTTDKNFRSLVSGDFTDGQDKVFSTVGSVDISVEGDKKYVRGDCDFSTGKYECTESTSGTMDLATCETDTNCYVKGDDYVLKFRVIFPGVWPQNKFIDGYEKVSLLVESAVGTTWLGDVTMTKVAKEETTDIKDGDIQYQVYQASVPLKGFNYNKDLAVTIKGVKHLGMRFGEDNQKGCYRSMIGKIGSTNALTKDETTTPLFNFIKTPLPGGDVDNNDIVNAADYSQVKSKMLTCDNAKCGEDINGDGIINSTDASYINLTVSDKCGDWWTTGE